MPTFGGGISFLNYSAMVRAWFWRERVRPYRLRLVTAANGSFQGNYIWRGRGQDFFSVCFPYSYTYSCNPSQVMEQGHVYREAGLPHRLHAGIVIKSSECAHPAADIVPGPPCDSKSTHPAVFKGFVGVQRMQDRAPRWRAWWMMTAGSTPVPGVGTYAPDQNAICAKDMINANACNYVLLAPIPPTVTPQRLAEWGMPQDAASRWIANTCRTYLVPCYPRAGSPSWPLNPNLRYVADPTAKMAIEPNLRALVGFSGGNANPAWLAAYPFETSGTTGTDEVVENIWRRHRCYSASHRVTWTTDPLQRGWSVQFDTYCDVWFTCNTFWGGLAPFPGPGQPFVHTRWNQWYEGQVRVTVRGDVDDQAFRAFVLSHNCGFGVRFRPKFSHGCDPFVCCAGLNHAMGDTIVPSQALQDWVAANGMLVPPSLQAGLGYSYAYTPLTAVCPLPEYCPIHGGDPGNPGPLTPYCPLPHIVRRELLKRDGTIDRVEDGYSLIGFGDVTPTLLSA